jgi:aldose 1-epimerase|tara:strand:- start:26173 stop:27306 length:1134 start_codon:yes stop_codon:yes gene_type:complete
MKKGLKFFLSFLIIPILIINSCSNIKENTVVFGKLDNGDNVFKYLLKNNNCEVEVITYGGIITSIKVPDINNNLIDIALGFNNLDAYLEGHPYFGAIVGRFANRIDNGKFLINEEEYKLAINNNGTSLHGGIKGFDKVNWNVVNYDYLNKRSIKLNYLSKHMEEGYPGNLDIYVTYTLLDNNELKVEYQAETDKTTVLNLTQHSYFNLSGESSGDILDHELLINADSFLPVNEKIIPTGEIKNVQDTPFDFRERKKIRRDILKNNRQLKLGNGYDHCWVLNDYNKKLRKISEVYSNHTRIKMEVFTDLPGLQLYSGNFLDGSLNSKKGKKYINRSGLCLETQAFPNSPNNENFPTTILEPGEKFYSQTSFRFSTTEK